MNELPTIPMIDPTVIRQALDRSRQAESLGDNPLKRLVWLRQKIEQAGLPLTSTALDMELGESLIALIAANRARLRGVVGEPPDEPPNRRNALDQLRADFSRSHTELEAWSALYFRYARIDLDLRSREMAQVVSVDPRQLRRRFEHGYRRMAEILARLERDARAANHRLWMRLKLPPAPYARLVGTDELLSRARDLLLAGPPPHTLALVGPGGIGKTALAHATSQGLLDEGRFSDVAWIELNERAAYPALVSMVAQQLGLITLADGNPAEIEAGLRLRLASAPALVVIDGADALDNLDDTLSRLDALIGAGRVLLTLRRHPTPQVPLRLMAVEPLPREIMKTLLADFAQLRHLPAHGLADDALAAIADAVGGNPLAGRLAVGQAAYLPLERVLETLDTLPARGDENLFEALFEEAWQSAGAEARSAAMALLLLPAEGSVWSDIRAICGLKPDDLDRSLESLAVRSLINVEGEEPRYALPSLARRFVEARSHVPPYRESFEELIRRAEKHLGLASGPSLPASIAQALALLHEQSQLGTLPDDLGRRMARVAPFVRRSGQWLAWRDLLRAILERLGPAGATPAVARALAELGVTYRWLGETDLARLTLEEAIAAYGETGDFAGQAETLIEIGLLHQSQGERDAASEAYERAASVAERYRLTPLRRRALNGLAGLALDADQPEQALKLLQAALPPRRAPPDGQILGNLGMAYLRLGDTARAIEHERQALDAFIEQGDLPRQARSHVRLGMAYHADGQPDQALFHLGQGLEWMRALGDALGQARTLNNLGAVYVADQRFEEALAIWRDALALQEQLGDRVGMAYTAFNLADLLWKLDRPDPARQAMASARTLASELSLPSLLARIGAHPLNDQSS